MDIVLDGIGNFAAFQKIMAKVSPVKIILLWPSHQQVAITKALSAGCAGGIIEDAQPTEYFLAIRQIVKGNVFLLQRNKENNFYS